MIFTKLLKPRDEAPGVAVAAVYFFYAIYLLRAVALAATVLGFISIALKWPSIMGMTTAGFTFASAIVLIATALGFAFAKDLILNELMDEGRDVARAYQAAILSVLYRCGVAVRVQKLVDEAVVLHAGGRADNEVVIEWEDTSDGIHKERILVNKARKRGIRGGHTVTYRRIIHEYPGLGLVQESEKVIFCDNDGPYLVEDYLRGVERNSLERRIGIYRLALND